MAARLRSAVRDLVELFAIPALAAWLPWPLCFRLYRALARLPVLYRAESLASAASASRYKAIDDPAAWAYDCRLTRMVDHADMFLSRFRGDGWLDRYVRVQGGDWPPGGAPFLAITFHWACGFWGLRHLHARRGPAAVVVLDIPEGAFGAAPIRGGYADMRTRETARAGGTATIASGVNSLREVKRRIQAGQKVVALLDVPPEGKRNVLYATLLGRRAMFPRGLVYLAASMKIPVVAYAASFDRQTGKRRLFISEPLASDNEQEIVDFLVGHLEQFIMMDPPAWHQWAGVDAFFQPEPWDGGRA